MKTAIVYDRVNKFGGAERVLINLHRIFPEAHLYTSIYEPQKAKWANVFPQVHVSFLQKLPKILRKHEWLSPFMPLAFESFNFSEYDLVISVTSEAAKGIITSDHTKHICICLTPTRYLWSGYDEYFKGASFKGISSPVIRYLRYWDKIAAQRPDKMIAISTEVQKRIKRYYKRKSRIIYPPVVLNESKKYKPKVDRNGDEYYLIVSRLVPYKKIDLAIRTFNSLEKKLIIVGEGSQEKKLKRIARQNIHFVGFVNENKLASYFVNAKALIFPQYEDFGLVPLEAMSFGVPVIAYKKGGVLDTVVDGVNGIFFETQTVKSLSEAINKFELLEFDKNDIYNSTKHFEFKNFKSQLLKIINDPSS